MPNAKAKSYAAQAAASALAPFEIVRREPGPSDVEIEIHFCGVCHSELHQARDERHNTVYPCVPGHEIVGRVTRVGGSVKKFKVGDPTGVGCMVDSCRTCESCKAGNEQYGAHEVVISKNEDETKHHSTFNFVLDAVSPQHDINAYLMLLKLDGTLCLVGAPEHPLPVSAIPLLFPRRNFAGSAIGGVAETQEMLDSCAKHGLASDIEIIPIQKVNEAYGRLLKQDVRHRFVIDMASLKNAAA